MSRLRTSWTDLVDDVTAELVVARSRALTILVGVALSTGALVSSAGISATARDQIAADLAASTVDSLTVSAAASARAGGAEDIFPDDTEARVRQLALVREAGRVLELDGLVDGLVTRLPGTGPVDIPVLAATSGYLAARDSGAGQAPVWLLDGSEPVALLGVGAADALGVPVIDDPTGLTVQIDGAAVQVVGYLTTRDESLASSIVVPYLQGVERLGSGENSADGRSAAMGSFGDLAGFESFGVMQRQDVCDLVRVSAAGRITCADDRRDFAP